MKSIIHSTENNNFYLYDTQRILSMLIHPELKKIHEKSTDINIDAYYLKKYSYLVNHGFFGEAKPFEFKANITCQFSCYTTNNRRSETFKQKQKIGLNVQYDNKCHLNTQIYRLYS